MVKKSVYLPWLFLSVLFSNHLFSQAQSDTIVSASTGSGNAVSTCDAVGKEGAKRLQNTAAITVSAATGPGPVINASRTSGVAPLSVFFDASSTTGLTDGDFLQAHFSWDFGDTAGTWSHSGRPMNEASGFVVSHVFENPGTYTVTVSVMDTGRQTATETVTVNVSDPDTVFAGANTHCASLSGDCTGAPSGAVCVDPSAYASETDYFDAQIAWLDAAPNRRLLLRKGETWNNCVIVLSNAGPKYLGAFGDGANPRIVLAAQDELVFPFFLPGSDIRIFDLDIDGSQLLSHGEGNGVDDIGCQGDNILFGRVSIHNGTIDDLHGSVGWGNGGINNTIYQSEITNTGYFAIYVDGINSSILGCTVHQIRIATSFMDPPAARNNYIAHNYIDASRQAPTTGIKWHSRRGVITDNIIVAGTSRISSGDSGEDAWHPVNDNLGIVLVERNILMPSGNTHTDSGGRTNDDYISTGIGIGNPNFVARNNLIFNMDMAFDGHNMPWGHDPATNVHIYNNSIYMGNRAPGLNAGEGDFLHIVNLEGAASVSGWDIKNNIVYSVNSDGDGGGTCNGIGALFQIRSAEGIDSDFNLLYKNVPNSPPFAVVGEVGDYTVYSGLSDWKLTGRDPHSISASPLYQGEEDLNEDAEAPESFLFTSASFFQLASGSPAVGAGTNSVPVFEDFNRNQREASQLMDLGAFTSGQSSGPDITAPSVPQRFNATPASHSQVDLTWNASIDNVGVAGYHVFRDGVEIATMTFTSYSDTGLNADTEYTYRVTAYDAAGNESAPSSSASAITDSSSHSPGSGGSSDSGSGGCFIATADR